MEIVKVTVSENPEEPTYVESVNIVTLDNVDEIEIRKVTTFDGPELIVERDDVSYCVFAM